MRFCRKNTGPSESSLIQSESTANSGDSSRIASPDRTMSQIRFPNFRYIPFASPLFIVAPNRAPSFDVTIKTPEQAKVLQPFFKAYGDTFYLIYRIIAHAHAKSNRADRAPV